MTKFYSYEVLAIHRNVGNFLFELETTSTGTFSYTCTTIGGDTIVFNFPNYTLLVCKTDDSQFDVCVKNQFNVLLLKNTRLLTII